MRMRLISACCLAVALVACEGKVQTAGPAPTTTTPDVVTPETPTSQLPEFAPAGPKMRRLSRAEYVNTIKDIFGQHTEVPALEPDTRINGSSSIGNAQLATSPLGVEQYETAAFEIAEIMRSPVRVNLVDCAPSDTFDAECSGSIIRDLGLRLFRRPLTDDEVDRYTRVALMAAQRLNDFWSGIEFALAGLLQSPHFLYRTEFGPAEEAPDRRRLTSYEVASRLSYFLWATTPDEALLEAAANGELETNEQVRAQAARMLDSPRATKGLRQLWTEFFQLHGIEEQIKDAALYPEYDEALAQSMREETLLLLENFGNEDRDFREIFSTKTTFVDERLAALYGVTHDGEPGEFVEVTLDDSTPRRGILGHASFLSLNAHAVLNSPTERGKFVRQSLLCQPIPPPPPNVDTSVPDTGAEGETLRERLSIHMEIEGCSSCHLQMDPIGFGFEHFDALGRYRTEDNGQPVDATGDLDGETFDDAGELALLVAEHDSAASCMVRKIYRHALGHVETTGEERAVRELIKEWGADGYRLRELLLDLVSSEAFLFVEGGE